MDVDLQLKVNGEPVRFHGDPLARLLDVLRLQLGLTGAKEGCGEGECGACTVWLDGEPVCACLVPMVQTEGREVRTVEGLSAEELAPLESAFVGEGAVQCGACTPGMVMSARALLVREPHPDEASIRRHLAGNLCRCTGYGSIVSAVQKASEPARPPARRPAARVRGPRPRRPKGRSP